MSKRRYKYTVTDINKLAAAFPQAIIEEIIPASVKRTVNYVMVANLLDCKLEVPGIELEAQEQDSEPPAIIGGKADRL